MKYSLVKNIVVVLAPAVIFLLYHYNQIPIRSSASFFYNQQPLLLFNILAPCAIGLYASIVIIYAYVNRNSLVFLPLLCGAVLASTLYLAFALGLFGLQPSELSASGASQVTYVLVGAYGAGFWVSLVGFVRARPTKPAPETVCSEYVDPAAGCNKQRGSGQHLDPCYGASCLDCPESNCAKEAAPLSPE